MKHSMGIQKEKNERAKEVHRVRGWFLLHLLALGCMEGAGACPIEE